MKRPEKWVSGQYEVKRSPLSLRGGSRKISKFFWAMLLVLLQAQEGPLRGTPRAREAPSSGRQCDQVELESGNDLLPLFRVFAMPLALTGKKWQKLYGQLNAAEMCNIPSPCRLLTCSAAQ